MNHASPAPGVLYGIGVGPGDPDLITLRVIRALQRADIILAAASSRNEHSIAHSIAAQHLSPHAEVLRLNFPMTRDQAVLEHAWEENAAITATHLRQGKNAVFLTLGDPLIYSTFGYLLRTLQATAPELQIEVIPGITSYQAAAAKSLTVLCEGSETLLLAPGINDGAALENALQHADSAVILKTYRNAQAIYTALRNTGRAETAVFASRLGLEGEHIAVGLDNAPATPTYLSLMLSPAARPHPGEPEE